jgi:hypothetical protein
MREVKMYVQKTEPPEVKPPIIIKDKALGQAEINQTEKADFREPLRPEIDLSLDTKASEKKAVFPLNLYQSQDPLKLQDFTGLLTSKAPEDSLRIAQTVYSPLIDPPISTPHPSAPPITIYPLKPRAPKKNESEEEPEEDEDEDGPDGTNNQNRKGKSWVLSERLSSAMDFFQKVLDGADEILNIKDKEKKGLLAIISFLWEKVKPS